MDNLRLRYMALWLFVQSIVVMALCAIVLGLDVRLMAVIGFLVGAAQAVTIYVLCRTGTTAKEW